MCWQDQCRITTMNTLLHRQSSCGEVHSTKVRVQHTSALVLADALSALSSMNHAEVATVTKTKPAQADRQRFQLHPSVNTWRTFDPAASIPADASLVNQVQSALQVMPVMTGPSCMRLIRLCCAAQADCCADAGNSNSAEAANRSGLLDCRVCSGASGRLGRPACLRAVSRLLTGRTTWAGWASSRCKA